MTDSDPILRAIAQGDTACPDGRALARLGELIRQHATPPYPVEMGDLIRTQLADDSVRIQERSTPQVTASDQEIDALWDLGHDQGTDLGRLRHLISSVPLPRPVDLRDAVRASLSGADQRRDVIQRLDRGSRWRLWSAVILGHVAAVLAIAIFQSALHQPTTGSDALLADTGPASTWPGVNLSTNAKDPSGLLPVRLPTRWSDIHDSASDLFLLRRFPELRNQARHHYHMDASRLAVEQGLAWLQSQQGTTGTFGTLSGDRDRDLATQSLAVLALLGEGLDDHERARATRAGLVWISSQFSAPIPSHGDVPTGIAALAMVEGAVLLNDPAMRLQAEHVLTTLDRGLPPEPGAAGLGGFTLLTLETAAQEGLQVPPRLLSQARTSLARSLPHDDGDAGRLGLAAFSRLIYGYRDAASTQREIAVLSHRTPARAEDGTVDPLGWFFATLAAREAGGAVWDRWAQSLQSSLLPTFTPAGEGLQRVVPAAVRYADPHTGDVFATSLAVIDLQIAYRYLPLSGD